MGHYKLRPWPWQWDWRHWKLHSFPCISTAPLFLAASPPPTLELVSLEISLSEAPTKEPSLTLEEQASVYTENLSHYTHVQSDASVTALHRKQSSLFLKLPFWLLRLVKPCSVKRFFDSTEHSEVELVLSTKEERDTERKGRRPWKDQGKKSFAAVPGNLHVRMRKDDWKSRYDTSVWLFLLCMGLYCHWFNK